MKRLLREIDEWLRHKIRTVNSRMEATLKNGEKVTINRNYLNEIKRALGGDREE